MMEALILICLMIANMFAEEEIDTEAVMEGMSEDGSYDFADLTLAVGTMGSEVGDSLPDIIKGVGSISVARETGLLSGIGVDPSNNDSLLSKGADLLGSPWFWGGVGVVAVLWLSSRNDNSVRR